MSTTILKDLLMAAQVCLDSAKLISSIRPVVRGRLLDYEECIDVSLSQQLELVSGLMADYMTLCKKYEYDADEIGKEPISYSDAVCLLDHFVDETRKVVSYALTQSEYLSRATEISVRAQTFAAILQSKVAEQRAKNPTK